MTAYIGIDVSKQKLDVAWLRDPDTLKVKTKVFPNTPEGLSALTAWLVSTTGAPATEISVLMEATGVYHEALAYALHEAGMTVVVANPRHAHQFRESLGKRSKTDKKDSIALARFLCSRPHERWQPEPAEVRALKALLGRLQALDTDLQREQNRLEKAGIQRAAAVEDSIRKMLEALEAERTRLRRQIDDHFDNHPGLKSDKQLLESIPGIGSVLATELTAMLRSRPFRSASQAAAYLGLVPVMHESGTSVNHRPALSKAGPSRLRAKLYMGAVVATRYNPLIRQQYERLVERGKAKMSALGAAMKKLVQIAYGVLKHQRSYAPQWAS